MHYFVQLVQVCSCFVMSRFCVAGLEGVSEFVVETTADEDELFIWWRRQNNPDNFVLLQRMRPNTDDNWVSYQLIDALR